MPGPLLKASPLWGSVSPQRGEAPASTQRPLPYIDAKGTVLGEYETSTFLNVIIAQTYLRGSTQREKNLKGKIQALGERTSLDPSDEDAQAQFRQLEDELTGLRRKIWHQQQALHRAESSLQWPIKDGHFAERANATWNMRIEDLIQDCVSRDGCCGRACGCCRQRALSSQKKKGLGHCTVECACCIQDRGFELTEEEKYKNRLHFENLLWAKDATYAIGLIAVCFGLILVNQDPAFKQEQLKTRTATKGPASQNPASKGPKRTGSKDPPPPPSTGPRDTIGDVLQKSPRSKLKQALRFWS